MAYQEISDAVWSKVEPLLVRFRRKKSGGSPPMDFRCLLNGMFYLLKTGCQWSQIPACYGSKSTIHEHFQKWVQAGVSVSYTHLDVYKRQYLAPPDHACPLHHQYHPSQRNLMK